MRTDNPGLEEQRQAVNNRSGTEVFMMGLGLGLATGFGSLFVLLGLMYEQWEKARRRD